MARGSRTGRKHRLFAVAASGLSAVAAFLIAEIGLRIALPQESMTPR